MTSKQDREGKKIEPTEGGKVIILCQTPGVKERDGENTE